MNTPFYSIGGCHLMGYSVKPEDSYLKITTNYFKFTKGFNCFEGDLKKCLAILKERKYLPNGIFVLQLGNLESLSRLLPIQVNQQKRMLLISPHLSQIVKLTLLIFRDLIRRPLLNKFIFQKECEDLIFQIESTLPKKIIILSMFHSKDFSRNIYRKRANDVLKKLSSKCQIKYIDLYSNTYEHKTLFNKVNYTDNLHLNISGHQIVSKMLISAITD